MGGEEPGKGEEVEVIRVKMLPDEDAPVYYCNNVVIGHSGNDFVLVLVRNEPRIVLDEKGEPKREFVGRTLAKVFMSPDHAKALVELLGKRVEEYYSRFREPAHAPSSS